MVSTLICFNTSNDIFWFIKCRKGMGRAGEISFLGAIMMFAAVMTFIAAPQPKK